MIGTIVHTSPLCCFETELELWRSARRDPKQRELRAKKIIFLKEATSALFRSYHTGPIASSIHSCKLGERVVDRVENTTYLSTPFHEFGPFVIRVYSPAPE